MKKEFNPQDWLNNTATETDKVITRIEAAFTDITSSYADWLNVGFAFASEFGETGRSFFHRVSRFYTGYTKTDTDKQFDQCLKSKGHGITIKTFFHLAKQAGVDVGRFGLEVKMQSLKVKMDDFEDTMYRVRTASSDESDQYSVGSENSEQNSASSPFSPSTDQSFSPSTEPSPALPTFPDSIFDNIPDFLKQVVARASSREERDILLLGSLVTLSSCLKKIYGIYNDKKVHSNLYLFIAAQASAGKGKLVLCKHLVNLIHWERRDLSHMLKQKNEIDMREFNLLKTKDLSIEKPEKPAELLLFIPANSSSTGVFQLLGDNEGQGLIFETEGDTLSQAFKTDYGNYSDGFRKAFHHETINYYRRTDREYVEINCPCLSTVLSGTPRQILSLIPSAEDGLFSRFMFYYMDIKPEWQDMFANQEKHTVYDHFNDLGKEFYSLYKALDANPEIQFCFTRAQREQFHRFFTLLQDKYMVLLGKDYLGSIRRLGFIAFRMAMVLTALRSLETGDFSEMIECRDDDFQSVLSMTSILVRHASHVFTQLPEDEKPLRPGNKKEQFLEGLGEKFTYKEFVELAKSISIPERTAKRYVTVFCEKGLIERENQGSYIKRTLEGSHDIK